MPLHVTLNSACEKTCTPLRSDLLQNYFGHTSYYNVITIIYSIDTVTKKCCRSTVQDTRNIYMQMSAQKYRIMSVVERGFEQK